MTEVEVREMDARVARGEIGAWVCGGVERDVVVLLPEPEEDEPCC